MSTVRMGFNEHKAAPARYLWQGKRMTLTELKIRFRAKQYEQQQRVAASSKISLYTPTIK